MRSLQAPSIAQLQQRLIHDLYLLLDDGDRRVLELSNLTPLEFSVIQRLSTSQGRRLTDVGTELLCVKSTITRLVDRLEADGLVHRTPDPDDRRAQRLLLTARGLAVREQASTRHNQAIERRMACLTVEEQALFQTLLEKLRTGLRADLEVAAVET